MTSLIHRRHAALASLALVFLLACKIHAQILATYLDGNSLPILRPGDTQPVVLFFIASDCPISNRLIPEMKRIAAEFAPAGVRFWFVYPNVTETPKDIREHFKAYTLSGDPITDPGAHLARLAGVTLTPEAAIFIPAASGPRTVYAGRIDNRYLAIGNERPHATRHDLEDAIAALLHGRQPQPPAGPPVGCSIVSAR